MALFFLLFNKIERGKEKMSMLQKIEKLEKQTEKVEGIFQKSINRLTKINGKLDILINSNKQEIDYYKQLISETEAANSKLEANKEKNNKLKAKFQNFLSVEEE